MIWKIWKFNFHVNLKNEEKIFENVNFELLLLFWDKDKIFKKIIKNAYISYYDGKLVHDNYDFEEIERILRDYSLQKKLIYLDKDLSNFLL